MEQCETPPIVKALPKSKINFSSFYKLNSEDLKVPLLCSPVS